MSNNNQPKSRLVITKEDFGKVLQQLREDANLSQAELANKINSICHTTYGRSGVSKWESGSALPPVTILPVLSHFFEVPLSSFFAFAGKEAGIDKEDLNASLPERIEHLKREYTVDNKSAFHSLCEALDELLLEHKHLKIEYKNLKETHEAIGQMIAKSSIKK